MAFAVYGMAVVLAPALGPYLRRLDRRQRIPGDGSSSSTSPSASSRSSSPSASSKTHPISPSAAKKREGIDYWGLGLLILFIGTLQMVLDKGQEDDWFSSTFISTASILCVLLLRLLPLSRTHRRTTPSSTCASSSAATSP